MDDDTFHTLVSDGYAQLPDWVREKIKNVAILVEDEPSEAERRAQRLPRNVTLLGLYKGVPLTVRGDYYGIGTVMPDTITIYRNPIIESARHEVGEENHSLFLETITRIVADTVWHEFAHHFGMDEGQVRAREREKGIRH